MHSPSYSLINPLKGTFYFSFPFHVLTFQAGHALKWVTGSLSCREMEIQVGKCRIQSQRSTSLPVCCVPGISHPALCSANGYVSSLPGVVWVANGIPEDRPSLEPVVMGTHALLYLLMSLGGPRGGREQVFPRSIMPARQGLCPPGYI